jgi:general secretion pathway protein E
VEMGIEPFLLVGATVGCLSQRLVRRLCPACRRTAPIEPALVERFAKAGLPIAPGTPFHVPAGCAQCSGEGWLGRLPIAELLEMGEPVQRAVQSRAPTHDITDVAVKAGMVPLLADGLRAARAGETSLAEVLRVVG